MLLSLIANTSENFHRNSKPKNVLLTKDSYVDRPS